MRTLLPFLACLTLVACDPPSGGNPEPGPIDPFDEVAAEMADCVEDPQNRQADGPEGLRIAAVTQLGPLAPGGRTQVRVTLAEVSGFAFMNYPSVRLTAGDADLRIVDPEVGQWFGIFGCQSHNATFTVEAAAGARDDLPLRAQASTLACDRDGDCGDRHSVDVVLALD